MRKLNSFRFIVVILIVARTVSVGWAAGPVPGDFIGLFTYTQARIPLAGQAEVMDHLLGSNPYLKGVSIRIVWREIEPKPGQVDWGLIDRVIAVAHSHHVYFTLDPIAGQMTPDWVFAAGAASFETVDINPHHPTYQQTLRLAVPWDPTYHRLWERFLTALARRYMEDPSLLQVTINGHNQGLEMHMPRRPDDMDHWRQLGWSPERVESDWKSWIDFFARTFPATHLGLVISPMYDQSTMPVVEDLASYAVSKYGNRLILLTAVLNGRRDQKDFMPIRLCLSHPEVLNAQETVATFQDPQRQGSLELFVYNMRQLSPLYVRLWRQDAENVDTCRRILAEYSHARTISIASYQQELQSKGLYTTTDTYQASQGQGRGRGGGFMRRRGFGGFGGFGGFSPDAGGPSYQ